MSRPPVHCATLCCSIIWQGVLDNVDCHHAEWSEQQEDPNIEKLWEEDWDDDQVTGLACSADVCYHCT